MKLIVDSETMKLLVSVLKKMKPSVNTEKMKLIVNPERKPDLNPERKVSIVLEEYNLKSLHMGTPP